MTIGLCGSITYMVSPNDNAGLLMAYLAWGLGVMTAVYIVRDVSGAHMNPTMSLVFAVFRGFPRRDLWKYLVAQLLGGVAAAAIAYGLHHDALVKFAGSNVHAIGPAFWTSPRPGLGYVAAFFNEFVGTAILVAVVLALANVGDPGNHAPRPWPAHRWPRSRLRLQHGLLPQSRA